MKDEYKCNDKSQIMDYETRIFSEQVVSKTLQSEKSQLNGLSIR